MNQSAISQKKILAMNITTALGIHVPASADVGVRRLKVAELEIQADTLKAITHTGEIMDRRGRKGILDEIHKNPAPKMLARAERLKAGVKGSKTEVRRLIDRSQAHHRGAEELEAESGQTGRWKASTSTQKYPAVKHLSDQHDISRACQTSH